MGGRKFLGPGAGMGVGIGCTLFGIGWGFGGAPIGLWGMGAGGGCGVGVALLGWGAGAAFGAQYLPKDMLMGNRESNRNLLQVIQSKWDRSQETEEQAEEQ